MGVGERARAREREGERETHTETETERQRERQRQIETDSQRQTHRQTHRHRETHRDRHTDTERVFGTQHSSVHLFGSTWYGRSEGKPINSASFLQDLSAVAFETGLMLIGVTMIVSRFSK